MNAICASATDGKGHKVLVGSVVRLLTLWDGTPGPWVTVTGMHRQGYDGTILTVAPAPDPDFPHHFSGSANRFELRSGETP